MMIKGDDVLEAFSAMSRTPNSKSAYHLLNAYFVPGSVLSTFQALLNCPAALYMIDLMLSAHYR